MFRCLCFFFLLDLIGRKKLIALLIIKPLLQFVHEQLPLKNHDKTQYKIPVTYQTNPKVLQEHIYREINSNMQKYLKQQKFRLLKLISITMEQYLYNHYQIKMSAIINACDVGPHMLQLTLFAIAIQCINVAGMEFKMPHRKSCNPILW